MKVTAICMDTENNPFGLWEDEKIKRLKKYSINVPTLDNPEEIRYL
jgi:hypothetical protein